ncbi:MAG TPA: CPXCG motif-containing cysteine-rich protein [Nevskiaceae bacterium]|nr:CPXCG motif-containing cysteine-rich protein [Nevskiaceae bacterium]
MIEDVEVQCPYCGEALVLEIDTSAGSQRYTEDCSVCCQPMQVSVRIDDGELAVEVVPENG